MPHSSPLPGAMSSLSSPAALRRASEEVLEALVGDDPFAQRVFDSYRGFQRQALAWAGLSEEAYSAGRH